MTMAEDLAAYLHEKGFNVALDHRDLKNDTIVKKEPSKPSGKRKRSFGKDGKGK